ncbi:biliverdin-producing heme oxygenase [Altererythrobacter sp. MF3-039]|uniref:biliverdin-producing heme oxygenase n=1 Tax=Altererythrobacter sp. MF3-039 TaxID=3252901 RepID=UPI00390CC74A
MSIRSRLRTVTRGLHDRLDRAMPSDFSDRASYARFLRIQLAARLPVERWLVRNAPDELVPPSQTALIRHDLSSLGASQVIQEPKFELEPDGDALGVAWVLAGSHLGNRFLLKGLPAALELPTAFFSDTRMTDFWKGLQSRLEADCPKDADLPAERSATIVFDLFLALAGQNRERIAA